MQVNPRLFLPFSTLLKPAAALLTALLLCGPINALAEPASKGPLLFGRKETRSDNFKPFKKWRGAMKRFTFEATLKSGDCTESRFNKCHYRKWQDFLDTLKTSDPAKQIEAVNRYFNKSKYITDKRNWGIKDYWETPGEFFNKFGDCEDFAIVKYLSLKKLGFAKDKMRIVAVKDQNLKVGHAILAVYRDEGILILDNQIKQVANQKSIHHYKPVFSINETHWWRHR